MDENVSWDDKNRRFVTTAKETNEVVGYIDRTNFEEVRDMMLQMNYINLGEAAKPVKHSSDKAKELWEKAQEYLKRESKKRNQR